MKSLRTISASVFLILTLLLSGQIAIASTLDEKAGLQAAMLRHIDRQLVDGAYLHLDRATGEARQLYPTKAHPMILTLGDSFVLCSEFKDGSGATANIDFYMARNGSSYVVFETAVDDRDMLMRWMSEGKAERFD